MNGLAYDKRTLFFFSVMERIDGWTEGWADTASFIYRVASRYQHWEPFTRFAFFKGRLFVYYAQYCTYSLTLVGYGNRKYGGQIFAFSFTVEIFLHDLNNGQSFAFCRFR